MVTKGHFITIKFFSGAARGQRQGHGGTYQLVGYPWATFLQLIVWICLHSTPGPCVKPSVACTCEPSFHHRTSWN